MELILDGKSIEIIRYKIIRNPKNNAIVLKCRLSSDFNYRNNLNKIQYNKIILDGFEYDKFFIKSFSKDNLNECILEFTNDKDFLHNLSIEEIFDIHETLNNLIRLLKNKQIPEEYDCKLQKLLFKNEDTIRLNEYGGYTMLSKDWIDDFAEWINDRKVLEIGAGVGALSKELTDRYITLESIDDRSWDRFNWKDDKNKKWFYPKEENYLDTAEKYKDYEIIILSYPVQGETSYNLYKKIKEINPNSLIIYIGPFRNDYVTDDFINGVEIIEDKNFQKISEKYCYWFGQPYMESKMLLLN